MTNSWLFVREQHSIYVVRADAYGVLVAGPGRVRQHLAFADERGVQEYQTRLAERMAARGWILYGVDQQRRAGEQRPRPHPQERRAPFTAPNQRQ
jgi:hypothetical protein